MAECEECGGLIGEDSSWHKSTCSQRDLLVQPLPGGSIDFEESQIPITDSEAMFLMLNEEMQNAQNAGFSHEQSFALIQILFKCKLGLLDD